VERLIVSEPIWTPLEAEETRLKRELLSNATFRRLEAVRDSIRSLKRAYGHIMSETAEVRISAEAFHAARKKRGDSVTSRVTQLAEDSMRTSGRRITSGQILTLAKAAGIPFTTDKPQSMIASILSHAPQFKNGSDSHGIGYGLAEWEADDEPDPNDFFRDAAPPGEPEEAP
jgi:hypothetical protein